MFVTKKKHLKELNKLQKRIKNLESIIQTDSQQIQKLKMQLKNEQEIVYNYNFPQKPKTIVVSKYVAEKFLRNKTTFVPMYPFPNYQYEGLDIRVDDKLKKHQVMFEAWWEEPPVFCKNCDKKNDYEFSYPRENPQFCNKDCFETFIDKKTTQ